MGLHSIIDSKIIIANPDPLVTEFGKSLTSRFGEMILKAEELFGKRNLEYTLLGFEFIINGQHIYYLGDEINKQILIHLPLSAIQDYPQCLYMLSHEAFHCLGPKRSLPATRLEEGLATYFANYYMNFIGFGSWNSMGVNYNDAMNDVKALLAIDADIVKNIRVFQLTTSLISKDNLFQTLRNPASDYLLNRLLLNFIY